MNAEQRLTALATRLAAKGASEQEIRKRLEEEVILIQREAKYAAWLTREHDTHAHSTPGKNEDEL